MITKYIKKIKMILMIAKLVKKVVQNMKIKISKIFQQIQMN